MMDPETTVAAAEAPKPQAKKKPSKSKPKKSAKKTPKPKRKKTAPKKAKSKKSKTSAVERSERLDMRLSEAEKAKLTAKAKKTKRTITSLVIEAIAKIK